MKKREKKMDKYKDRFKQILRLLSDREYTQEQLDWIDCFRSSDNKIVQLSGDRNSGRSTTGLALLTASAIDISWIANVVICENRIARSHLDYICNLIETFSLPYDFKPIIKRTRDSIELDNGSRIMIRSSTNSLRGFSLKNVFFDTNVKSIDDIGYETISSIFPAVCPVGKILVSMEKQ